MSLHRPPSDVRWPPGRRRRPLAPLRRQSPLAPLRRQSPLAPLRRQSLLAPLRRQSPLAYILLLMTIWSTSLPAVGAIILTGGPTSFARYPKWAHSFENTLTLEMKTRQSNGLIMYTDDGNVNGNFYCLSIVDGTLTLDFRLGDRSNDFARSVYTIRVEEVKADDDRWHAVTIHQSWENIKLTMDTAYGFRIVTKWYYEPLSF